jgi:multimeric flavodoxin WrbA
VLNKYFTISSMPVVSSTYWNNVFGANGEDALQDAEGMAVMENLGNNMAWMLKCIQAGKAQGIAPPEQTKARTNFIR